MNERQNLLLHGQKLKRAYDSVFRPVMARHGLTRNEVDVLLFLANNPGRDTAVELVELRGLAKSQVCRSVEALQARGMLVGEQDPQGPPPGPPGPDRAGGGAGAGGAAGAAPFYRPALPGRDRRGARHSGAGVRPDREKRPGGAGAC